MMGSLNASTICSSLVLENKANSQQTRNVATTSLQRHDVPTLCVCWASSKRHHTDGISENNEEQIINLLFIFSLRI